MSCGVPEASLGAVLVQVLRVPFRCESGVRIRALRFAVFYHACVNDRLRSSRHRLFRLVKWAFRGCDMGFSRP